MTKKATDKFVDKYNLGGRPRAFASRKEMIKGITAYFDSCLLATVERINKDGNKVEVISPAPLWVGDMASFLGVTNQTLLEYAKGTYGDEYNDVLARAKQYIEGDIVKRGATTSYGNFAQFILKNNFAGWKENAEPETPVKLLVEYVNPKDEKSDDCEENRNSLDVPATADGGEAY